MLRQVLYESPLTWLLLWCHAVKIDLSLHIVYKIANFQVRSFYRSHLATSCEVVAWSGLTYTEINVSFSTFHGVWELWAGMRDIRAGSWPEVTELHAPDLSNCVWAVWAVKNIEMAGCRCQREPIIWSNYYSSADTLFWYRPSAGFSLDAKLNCNAILSLRWPPTVCFPNVTLTIKAMTSNTVEDIFVVCLSSVQLSLSVVCRINTTIVTFSTPTGVCLQATWLNTPRDPWPSPIIRKTGCHQSKHGKRRCQSKPGGYPCVCIYR